MAAKKISPHSKHPLRRIASKFKAAHDYTDLVKRWRQIAKQSNLQMHRFAQAGKQEIFYLESSTPQKAALHSQEKKTSIYLSAGIHGDEPAGPAALLHWAETNKKRLSSLHCLIFPCLNPWGLINNRRTDSQGRDLNRSYHDNSIRQTAAHKSLLLNRRFDLAIALHEDYDAPGYYIYATNHTKRDLAKKIINTAAAHIPIDNRSEIEGIKATKGLLLPKILPKFKKQLPEALLLFPENTDCTFTLEAPSEYFLDDRILAHSAVLDLVTSSPFLNLLKNTK
ncbi:MAG: M14 family metallocarboxypeptidase [Chthoniobacterales bacterium]